MENNGGFFRKKMADFRKQIAEYLREKMAGK